jgi:catechol 2,3-dioxygenase-like lactoylglutathione lyase family enzyme
MTRSIAQLTLVVRDYDEAIRFFTAALRFDLVEDTPFGGDKRWVVVSPQRTGGGTGLLLAKATNPEQLARVGDQSGGRVFLFLQTQDFWADYHHMQAHGVIFDEEPRQEPYAIVAVFRDLYGNKWDLLQRTSTLQQ